MKQMKHTSPLWLLMTVTIALSIVSCALSLEKPDLVTAAETQDPKTSRPPHDAVTEAQEPRSVSIERPEQRKTEHDRSGIFEAKQAKPSSPAFLEQPRDGKILGFDFYRDPLGSEKPMQEPEEMMKKDIAAKPKVMETQRCWSAGITSILNLIPKPRCRVENRCRWARQQGCPKV